uniref:Rx N-terminal domain-containing protein n=1 Tax=Oryza meridionalis TaxID=40149 RepID=A0A0E0F3K8_9ORYZ
MKPCLKICFGYCAMFPKGQRIVKDDLICQWICLDLIETSKMVGEKIGSAIGGRIKLQWDFNYDLKDMKMTLETIEVFLKDAERRSIREESVRLWLRRLKNVMYNISDMIDGFEAETTRKRKIMFPNLAICAKIKTAKEMKRMRGELEKVTKQHRDFSFASENSSNIQEVVSSDRKTSSKVEETAIIGRIQEKQKILDCLSNKILTQDFIILAIYGMGGIGKTTLAQLVMNDKKFKEFSPVADEWESMRDSNIWNESTSEDTSSPHHMLASLKLSYLTMKPCLKICFGYCAMFPKGQRIVKDDLICQWICLDLIETSKVYSSKQLGEIYVNQLLGMSFLQHLESQPARSALARLLASPFAPANRRSSSAPMPSTTTFSAPTHVGTSMVAVSSTPAPEPTPG